MAQSPLVMNRSRSRIPNHVDENSENNMDSHSRLSTPQRTPFVPMQSALVGIRERLEQQMSESGSLKVKERISPGLAQLRNTPGRGLKEKQKLLAQKHQEAKSKVNTDGANVGGGISIWPEMDNMRLTKQEVINLTSLCVLLMLLVVFFFVQLHGKLMSSLDEFATELAVFHSGHDISFATQELFDIGLIEWHKAYQNMIVDLHSTFDQNFADSCVTYQICVITYIVGIITLLYWLADNMWARSKLTPNRIKIWVTLLVVIGSWTSLIVILLVRAYKVERRVEDNVISLSNLLGDLVLTDLDISRYRQILHYWQTRCLPPTSQGSLTVLGLVPLQDVTYYLQYYSLPIVTAIFTPILRLLISLKDIYSAT
ncbi:uncharacterized protein LOC135501919 isoform X2 [Lineus longissimus]